MFNSLTANPKNAQVLATVAVSLAKEAQLGRHSRSAGDFHRHVNEANRIAKIAQSKARTTSR